MVSQEWSNNEALPNDKFSPDCFVRLRQGLWLTRALALAVRYAVLPLIPLFDTAGGPSAARGYSEARRSEEWAQVLRTCAKTRYASSLASRSSRDKRSSSRAAAASGAYKKEKLDAAE